MAHAGATLTRAKLPVVEEVLALSAIIYTPEAWAEWRDLIETRPEAVFPPILARFRSGAEHSAADYSAAWASLDGLRKRYLAQVAGYDAVLLPTAPNMPPNTERLLADEAYYTTENLLTLRNTRIANMLGLCALTLPTNTPSAGISLMVGRWRRTACCVWVSQRNPWCAARARVCAGYVPLYLVGGKILRKYHNFAGLWRSFHPRCWTQTRLRRYSAFNIGAKDPETQRQSMQGPERFSNLPEYAFPRLRALLDHHAPGGAVRGDDDWRTAPRDAAVSGRGVAGAHASIRQIPRSMRVSPNCWTPSAHGWGGVTVVALPQNQIMALNGTREGLFNAALALCPEQKNGQRPIILTPNPFYQSLCCRRFGRGGRTGLCASNGGNRLSARLCGAWP